MGASKGGACQMHSSNESGTSWDVKADRPNEGVSRGGSGRLCAVMSLCIVMTLFVTEKSMYQRPRPSGWELGF